MAIIQDVKPTRVESGYVEAPFDVAKAELEANRYKLISLEQFAQTRIDQGKDSHVANGGAYTREGFLYVPQRGIFLVRNSPINANAKEATQAHREGREYFLTAEQVEEALKDSVQFKDSSSIPTRRFGEDEKTVFAFRQTAGKYGEFLKEAGIKEIPVYLASLGNKPFARQAWLRRLVDDDGSGLSGSKRVLDYNYAVRGVRIASADEGSASVPRKIITVESLLEEASRTSSFAPNQVKILGNILEQRGYIITPK
jgi:hypothetical protein